MESSHSDANVKKVNEEQVNTAKESQEEELMALTRFIVERAKLLLEKEQKEKEDERWEKMWGGKESLRLWELEAKYYTSNDTLSYE